MIKYSLEFMDELMKKWRIKNIFRIKCYICPVTHRPLINVKSLTGAISGHNKPETKKYEYEMQADGQMILEVKLDFAVYSIRIERLK